MSNSIYCIETISLSWIFKKNDHDRNDLSRGLVCSRVRELESYCLRGPSERGLCLPFHLRSKLLVHCHSFCPGQKPTWYAMQLHGDPPLSWPLPPGPFLPCLCGLSCTRGPGGAGPCVSSATGGVWRAGEPARVGESCRKSVLGLEEMRVASEAGGEEGQERGFKDMSSAGSYSPHSQALGSTPCLGNAGREGILEAAAKVTAHPPLRLTY